MRSNSMPIFRLIFLIIYYWPSLKTMGKQQPITMVALGRKPGAPYAKNVTYNSVTLGWTHAASGSEKVSKYKVMYRQYNGKTLDGKNDDEKKKNWTEVYTNGNHKKIIISNLPSKTTFVFKVQSITAIGRSTISGLSKPIKTLTKKKQKGESFSSSFINYNSTWKQHGFIIAGGNERGDELNQLSRPHGIYVDDDNRCIYIANLANDRIIKWKYDAENGEVVAGGNGEGNRMDQLNGPTAVIVDKKNDDLIICDRGNRRVIRWPLRNDKNQEIIISDIDCWDLTMDNNGDLYVCDNEKNEVRRWKIGEKRGTIVAGGNGQGNKLNQLYCPFYIFVNQDYSVYVSDYLNNRVMKWMKGAKEGIVVAGGQGEGNSLTQLDHPTGVIVDHLDTVYVADYYNNRIMRWLKGSKEGSIIFGGNPIGQRTNQLIYPKGLSLDREGTLYVVDHYNNRVAKFVLN